VILALAVLSLAAPQGQGAPVFPAEVRLVVVHPTVRNRRGELVTGLDRGAFTVYENGKPQPISVFRRDDVPVSLGILIDNSGSMRKLRGKVEAAALAFVRASNPQDEMFVLNFADKSRVDVALTTDHPALEAGIAGIDSIGGTAMRDAIEVAEAYLNERATRDRKGLLLITDGNDNASVTPMDRIRKRAEQRDIAIYAVGLQDVGDSAKTKRGRDELDDLTEGTGGFAHYPSSNDEVEAAALAIARQIRSEYTLGYSPLNQALDGSYRKLRVEVRTSEHVSVRTRAGYRATSDSVVRPGQKEGMR
jgi:Ca-activated chloride channel homolog